jgi:hypothetical protein
MSIELSHAPARRRLIASSIALTLIAVATIAAADPDRVVGSSAADSQPRTNSAPSASIAVRVDANAGVGTSSTTSPTPPATKPDVPAVTAPTTDARPPLTFGSSTTSDHAESPPSPPKSEERLLQGFRFGYSYITNYQTPVQTFNGQSIADKVGMRSPHSFLVGYEAMYRMAGHSWLNVILVGNVMIGGLEQSKFYPTANALLGFEFNNSFQVGVGVDVAPLEGSIAHTIFAAGWTPLVGNFYVPIHAFFIPDVDGNHRMGITTGVTW